MSNAETDFIRNNRDLIIKITQSILLSERSPEVNYVERFLDVYTDNLEDGNATGEAFTAEEVPLGFNGDILLTALILPIIVNLTTETYKKMLEKHNEKYWKEKGSEIEEMLSVRLKNKRRAKKISQEIIKIISQKN